MASRGEAGTQRAAPSRHRDCLYRRSSTVVLYTAGGGELVAADFALGIAHVLTPELTAVLASAGKWISPQEAARQLPFLEETRLRRCLAELEALQLVESSATPTHPRRRAMSQWATWSPHAAFFHFGTRNLPRISLEDAEKERHLRLLFEPAPPALKAVPRTAKRVRLPPAIERGGLSEALLARRSWRRFGAAPVTRQQLATLLGLTWGVRRWMHVTGGPRPLKTSPSGGACHSIEAYVVVQHVEAVVPGVYHYCPDRHTLSRLFRRKPPPIGSLLGQPWFADCAAAVVMTSVWPRVQWKYGSSRSYRSVLVEVGHFAQTFELLAASMGLAPFCTGMFDDAAVERTLRVDGINEGALFVVGVGTRPPGAGWAPFPEPDDTPRTTLPAHARRRRRSSHER